ncbi:MAG: MFS transporter [Rhodospirillaceae bacterium]|nr:MAG: MFS transporter [Rhodospirillaceae bacterium]
MTDFGPQHSDKSWGESARAFLNPKVISLLFLGFSAGVPILLVFSTLSVWLREAGVERATIGFFSWAALAYGFKFIWSPLVDKLPVPLLAGFLGPRRAWLLVAQTAIIGALCFMALTDPVLGLKAMAIGAILLAFSSATQDIVIDAYRIESADDDLQGLMSATYIAGYRIGMIVAGAGSLEISGFLDVTDGYDFMAWQGTYFAMAAVMGIGVVTTFMISEPGLKNPVAETLDTAFDYGRFVALFALAAAAFVVVFMMWPSMVALLSTFLGQGLAKFVDGALRLSFSAATAFGVGLALVRAGLVKRQIAYEAYVAPFADFFARFGRVAILMLLLIATFRIADIVMGVMANVFYVDLGFEKQEIGRISKGFGLGATILGGFVGGLITVKYGVMKTLFLGGFLAAATNVLFAGMSTLGPQIWALMVVIAADNLAGGIASVAFVAYLSSLTSRSFTATQYALFSSLMMLLPKLIAGYSGVVVDAVGYVPFFLGTAALGLIPLVLIVFVVKYADKP